MIWRETESIRHLSIYDLILCTKICLEKAKSLQNFNQNFKSIMGTELQELHVFMFRLFREYLNSI